MNMKNCGRRNVSKHIEIKGSDKYATLEISLKFYSLDKMRIKYSESKVKFGRSGKGLITSLGLRAKTIPKKYKKARYAIRNVSKKDLSKIIREFENCLMKLMRRRGPSMSPWAVNFTYQDSSRSVRRERIPSTWTITL